MSNTAQRHLTVLFWSLTALAVAPLAAATNPAHPLSMESDECGVEQHLFSSSTSGAVGSCVASTLRGDLLLTAAHCLCDGTYNPLTGGCVGSWMDTVDGVSVSVSRPGGPGDMALVLSDEPLERADDTCRRCVSSDHVDGAPVSIVGYASGAQESIDTFSSLHPLFGAYQFAGDTMCAGDSGGPVLSSTGAVLGTNSGGWPVPQNCGVAGGLSFSSPVNQEVIDLLTTTFSTQTSPAGGIQVTESLDASVTQYGTAHCYPGLPDVEVDPDYYWSYSFSFSNVSELETFYDERGLIYFDFSLGYFGTSFGDVTMSPGTPVVQATGAAVSCRQDGNDTACRGMVTEAGLASGVILDIFVLGETECGTGSATGARHWFLRDFDWGDTASDNASFEVDEVCL